MAETPAWDDATLRFYADEAPVYAASGPNGTSRHLVGFLERLSPGARILELGCGGGRDSAAMLAQGFEVDPTDAVPAIARQAEARIGRPVRILRFHELNAMAEYDGVWASMSLLHVPRSALPDVLARIFRALRPGGVHFANYKSGGQEGRDGFGRYFNYLTAVEVAGAYRRSAPWNVLGIEEYTGGGYDNSQGPRVAFTGRRPA